MTEATHPPALEPAELLWRDSVPESARFGDVSFSRKDRLAGARYVFIEPNALPDRFARMPSGSHFVIAETGFGTGLNFLATWAEWRKQHKPGDNTALHFVSVERYPVTQQDLRKALALWPELAA